MVASTPIKLLTAALITAVTSTALLIASLEELNARLCHIPVPDGAAADFWYSIRADDGDAVCALEWSATCGRWG